MKHYVFYILLVYGNRFLLYSPLNQGLKLCLEKSTPYCFWVFTLQSIKSRIETFSILLHPVQALLVFTLQSIKSRIETGMGVTELQVCRVFTLQSIKSRIETVYPLNSFTVLLLVFTLQSIKSRIETGTHLLFIAIFLEFLLYSPLNQGLKLNILSPALYFNLSFYSTVH